MKGLALLGLFAFVLVTCAPSATPTPAPTAIPTATLTPLPTMTLTPWPTPTPTPTPGLSRFEAQTALINYLLKQISDIPIDEKRREFGATVGGFVPTAEYQGEGKWVLRGQGMKREPDGRLSWVEGRWSLEEASLAITPINSEAFTLLEVLKSWRQALPTPTPLPPPTPKASISEIIKQHRAALVKIETPTGVGSGTIITSDGHILTNWHVVEGHARVDVIVQDTYKVGGSVVGYDQDLDLAVIKIGGGPWPLLAVSSYRPSVGEEVLILGYALDLPGQSSLTKGLVSAVRPDDRLTWIQTDAAINKGNSGGAALNSSGQFIGVPTWKLFGISQAENVGFLVALFSVADEIPRLMAGDKVASPPATPPAQRNAYYNSQYQYQVDLASGWIVDDSAKDRVIIRSQPDYALLQIFSLERPGHTLDAFANEVISFRRSEAKILFELSSRSVVTLPSGLAAMRIEYRAQNGSEYCLTRVVEILVLSAPQAFELLGSICEVKLGVYQADLEAIQNSFVTLSPGPTATPPPTVTPNVLPNRFFGTVMINGVSAPEGTTVRAAIDGEMVGLTTISGGYYRVDVVQPMGKSFTGKIVTFAVNGVTAAQTATWEAGAVTNLNLSTVRVP